MRAGQLRHPLTIAQPGVESTNDFGEVTRGDWVAFASVRGDVSPLAGRELERARQTVATATHRITTRYVAGVLPSFRIVFGSRAFEVNDVQNPGERGRELILICTETIGDVGSAVAGGGGDAGDFPFNFVGPG